MNGTTVFAVLLLSLLEVQHVHCWVLKSQSIYSNALILRASTEVDFTIPKFANTSSLPYPSPLHKIYVRSILSDEEALKCLNLAQKYAIDTGAWSQPDKIRHTTYSTCDFPLDECESLSSYLEEIDFDGRMFNHFSNFYGVSTEEMSYLDCFCAQYRTPTDEQPFVMDRLEPHRDGSLLSFTITLNSPEEFEGGGTFFEALRDESPNGILCEGGVIRPSRAGDCVFHSGKLLHGANYVQSGTRTVLVGFIELPEWRFQHGALTSSCRDWGRLDVAELQYTRQLQKSNHDTKQWLVNQKWYSTAAGVNRSFLLRGLYPTFSSLENRAGSEYQRLQRLDIEDNLLRTVLVETEEIGIDWSEIP